MQAGNLVSSDVQAFTSRVLVNGVQRDFTSWSVDRELSGDLPAQIVAVSGITQATGNVEWAAGADLEDGSRNPWNKATGWLPARGDRVEVFAGDGVTEWKQFHGVIDKTTGSVGGGFQSAIIDDFDRLSASFAHPALLRIMPPIAWDGSEPYRAAGLTHLYYVDAALRTAGFFATPPRETRQALSVTAQGSMWPEVGLMTTGVSGGVDGGAWANSYPGPGFMSMGDVQNIYSTWIAHPMTEAVRFSMTVAPEHSGNTSMKTYYGPTDYVELAVAGSRTVFARLNGTAICSVVMGNAVRVSLLMKNGTWTLRTDTGVTSSGSVANPTSAAMDRTSITADVDSRVAGFHICYTSDSTQNLYTSFTPSAAYQLDTSTHLGLMDAGPTLEGLSCLDLLEQISNATFSAMWIDEMGVFNWSPSITLNRRETARTVSTLNSIFALDWEGGLLATASKVTVRGRRPAITKGRWRNLVLARGSGESLKSGDELSIFLEPESDTDWIAPSANFIEVGGADNIWGTYNNPAYSAVGLYYTADGGTTTVAGLTCAITTEQVGLQKILVKYSAGSWPSDVEGVASTSPTNGNLWPKNRNQGLPRLVGRGKVQWVDQEVVAIGAGGPGPELIHDAGVWANRTDSTELLERFASYLQSQTAAPKPTITGLEVTYDPRLQLGDVITIESPDLMGVSITALIVSLSNSAGGSYTQSLSVRIISATTTFTTYAEFNDSLEGSGLTYAQWQALGPVPQSYADFDNE